MRKKKSELLKTHQTLKLQHNWNFLLSILSICKSFFITTAAEEKKEQKIDYKNIKVIKISD